MSFFKALGEFMMVATRAHAAWELETSNRILHDPKRLMILVLLRGPDLRLRTGRGGTDDGSGSCRRRSSSRCARRQEGLQPGLLLDRDLHRLDPHRAVRRSDHRLHRRRRRLHHRPGPDVGRHQGHPGRRHRPLPHLRQGDHGQRDPPQAGQRLGAAGRHLSDRRHRRRHRRRGDQPGALRDQPGAVRRVHHHHLLDHARRPRRLRHDRLPEGPQERVAGGRRPRRPRRRAPSSATCQRSCRPSTSRR